MGSDNASGISGATVKINGVPSREPQRNLHRSRPRRSPRRSFYPCPFGDRMGRADQHRVAARRPERGRGLRARHELRRQREAPRLSSRARSTLTTAARTRAAPPRRSIDAGIQSGTASPRSAIVIRSDKPATVRGSLSGPANVAGSTVCLYEQVDLPGDGRELVDTGKVRKDGSFDLDVAPGPSRNLDVVYRNNNKIVERERLHIDAVVAPQFEVVGRARLVNGQKVRFRGSHSRPQRLGPWDQPAGARREEVANLQAGEGRSEGRVPRPLPLHPDDRSSALHLPRPSQAPGQLPLPPRSLATSAVIVAPRAAKTVSFSSPIALRGAVTCLALP